jgi:hypothetical protein
MTILSADIISIHVVEYDDKTYKNGGIMNL